MHRFGDNEGFEVYKALESAADLDINICTPVYPDYTQEPSILASGRPNVKNVTLLISDGCGSGIVLAKIWITDRRDVYIGSANNDWKSLTQVKGTWGLSCWLSKYSEKSLELLDNLWKLTHLNSSAYTSLVRDITWQTIRKVLCWSHFIDEKEWCSSPLPKSVDSKHVIGYPELSDPDIFNVTVRTTGLNHYNSEPQFGYLSFAPPQLCFISTKPMNKPGWIKSNLLEMEERLE